MLFPNKPRLLINNDLVFRCKRLVCVDDVVETDSDFQWEYGDLYEVRFTTNVQVFTEAGASYDRSVLNIICVDHATFNIGDRIVCVHNMNYHSINGIPDMYFDYEQIQYQVRTPYSSVPDVMFAEVVKLNEIEYIDYLYGRE